MSWLNISARRYEVSEQRLVICRECEFYTPRTTRCSKCMCFMSGKSLFLNAECPLKKWGKESSAEEPIN